VTKTSPHAAPAARTRLIEALAAVLLTKPLGELSVPDIARAARVSNRTFYEHFGNKEACFVALYAQNSARSFEVVAQALASGTSLEPRIAAGVRAHLEMRQEDALGVRLYVDIATLGEAGMNLRRRLVEEFAARLKSVLDTERTRLGQGPIPWELVLATTFGINELVYYHMSAGRKQRLEKLAPTVTELILLLMKSPAEAAPHLPHLPHAKRKGR
jgi:AcrR family transcriptional regulator